MQQPADESHPDAARVVLGLGGTVDFELEWDAAALGRLARELGIGVDDLDPRPPITDERSLLTVVLGHLAEGTGGEHFAASSDTVRRFAARFDHRVTLGGTNIRAAIAMALLDVPATVHVVEVDETMDRLLPPGTAVLSSGTSPALDPHLVVQYPAGARVRLTDAEIVAPHPNRVIVTNDPPNRLLTLAPGLGEAVRRAEVVMLSTLNAIQEPDVLAERLTQLEEVMTQAEPGTLVLWEEAGYHLDGVRDAVKDTVVRLADVYSMNEDELALFIGRGVDLLDPEDVAAALDELAVVVPAPTLVLHTKHWALARGARAPWLRAALRGGIAAATARYVHGDATTAGDLAGVGRFLPDAASAAFATALESRRADVVCEPGYRPDVARPTTIGLGDTFVGGFVAALVRP